MDTYRNFFLLEFKTFTFLAQGAENTEQNVEEGKDYTAKKADQVCHVSSNDGPFLMNFKAMKGAHKAKEDMKKELDK